MASQETGKHTRDEMYPPPRGELRQLTNRLPSISLQKFLRKIFEKSISTLLRDNTSEEDYLYLTKGQGPSLGDAEPLTKPRPEKVIAEYITGRNLSDADKYRLGVKGGRLRKERLQFHGDHCIDVTDTEMKPPQFLQKALGENFEKQQAESRRLSFQNWFARLYQAVLRLRNDLVLEMVKIVFRGGWNPLCGQLMPKNISKSLQGLREIRDLLIDEDPARHPLSTARPGVYSAEPVRVFRDPSYEPNADNTEFGGSSCFRSFKRCISHLYFSVSAGAIIEGVLELAKTADVYHFIEKGSGERHSRERSEGFFKQELHQRFLPCTTSDGIILHCGLSFASPVYHQMRQLLSNGHDVYSLGLSELQLFSKELFDDRCPPSGILYYGETIKQLIGIAKKKISEEASCAARMERALLKRAIRLKVKILEAPLTISCQVPLFIDFDHDKYEGELEEAFQELHIATYELEKRFWQSASGGKEKDEIGFPFHRSLAVMLSFFSTHEWKAATIGPIVSNSIVAAHQATAFRLIHTGFEFAFDCLSNFLEMDIEDNGEVQIGESPASSDNFEVICTKMAVTRRLEALNAENKVPFNIMEDPQALFHLLFLDDNNWFVMLFKKIHPENVPVMSPIRKQLKRLASQFMETAPQFTLTRKSPPQRFLNLPPLPEKPPTLTPTASGSTNSPSPEEMELCCSEAFSWPLPSDAPQEPPEYDIPMNLNALDLSRRWFINDNLAEPISDQFATALTTTGIQERTLCVLRTMSNLVRQLGRIFDSRPKEARQAFLSLDDNVLLSSLGGFQDSNTIRKVMVLLVCNALLCMTREELSDRATSHNTYLITLSVFVRKVFPDIQINEDNLIKAHVNLMLRLQSHWCITTNLLPDERHPCETLFEEFGKCRCRHGSCIWANF